MAKRKKSTLFDGLGKTVKAVSMTAKSAYYSETPQMKGRIAHAFAYERKGGRGKITDRPSYKKDMKRGIRQKTRQERGKIVYALARATKGGKGRIKDRPAHKKFLP